MQITIDIDENEIAESVKNMIVYHVAQKVEADLYTDNYYNTNRHIYRDEIKAAVRNVIREHKEDLEKRAVEAAAYTISHKALKQKINAVLEEG